MSAKFLDPKKIISEVPVGEKMNVADFGCNAGSFAIELAKIVGEEGEVLAVDILESALSVVTSRVEMEGLKNIRPVRVNLEVENAEKIPSQSQDIIFLINVLFQSKLHQAIIKEIHRTLKVGGYWVVADWKEFRSGLGPSKPEEVVEPESVQQMAELMGFKFQKDIQAGDYHWCKLFIKEE